MSRKVDLSRRNFMKGAALATGAGILAGCAPKVATTPIPTEAPVVSGDVIAKDGLSLANPPKIEAGSVKAGKDTEILIVGAGLSGLSAAMSAAELGAKVIVLEKTEKFSARGGDLGAVNTKVHKEVGYELPVEDAALEFMKCSGNKPDQRFFRLWAEKSGEAFDWFTGLSESKGLKWHITQWPEPAPYDNTKEYYRQYHSVHEAADWFGDWQIAVGTLVEEAVKKGVEFIYLSPVKQLVQGSDGKVTGVIAQNEAGEYIQYNASKAVVLSTGDYGHSPELMAQYCPQAADYAKTMSIYESDKNSGDGHMLGIWAGGVMERAVHAPMTHGFSGPLGCDSYLQVNALGERFQNEDIPGQSWTNAVERQPGAVAWQVFDSKWPDQLQFMPVGHGGMTQVTPMIEGNFTNAIDYTAWKGGATLPMGAGPFGAPPGKAENLDEMAEMMGVPADALKATIARYNELANGGKDLDFGKRPDRLFPIETAPFFFGRGSYSFLVVMGGLITDLQFRVLDKDYKPIPGLYANGNVVGQRFGGDYPTTCPGISHGMALTFGRIVGQEVAKL